MQTFRFNQTFAIFLIGILLLLTISDAGADTSVQSEQPYRVGVLLPTSGDDALDFYETLHWTAEGLQGEGIGTTIELVSIDTSSVPLAEAARRMLEDPTIRVVIGPASSDEMFQIAPDFIKAKKLLISPSATSAQISDLFDPSGYIWRTTGGDAIQTRLIMKILSEKGVDTATLLYENNTYGRTFADWADTYARTFGMNLTSTVPFMHGDALSGPIVSALAGDPDYLVVAARGSDAAEISQIMHKNGSETRLFFTDAAIGQTFIDIAGADAEGAEGVGPTADKKTGFFISYQEHFNKMPSGYAALTRDALVLAIAALARMDAYPSEDPGEAMKAVVSGKDSAMAWDDQGTARAIHLIRAGYLPDITGASGPLDYYPDQSADPITTWYVHWRVEEGKFLADSYIPGSEARKDEQYDDHPQTTKQHTGSAIASALPKDPRPEVSFVYAGEKGDFGYTDQVYLGILKAKKDMNLAVREIFTGDELPEPDPVVDEFSGKRASVVLMLGSYMSEYAQRVANQYPDVPVIVIDADPVPAPDIKSASFSMYGASYLAGILAANQTKTGKIAAIGGRKVQVIDSFTDGFIAGAARENPSVQVNITYIADDNSGYSQPDKGAAIAEDMHQNGTDIIFTVAGESGLGAISAAKQFSDLRIIGVDSDQSYLGPGVVMASVVKNLESVVYREIKGALEGSYSPGLEVNNLANNGSSLAINPRFRDVSTVVESYTDEAIRQEEAYSLLPS